jgi:hypothetical protein
MLRYEVRNSVRKLLLMAVLVVGVTMLPGATQATSGCCDNCVTTTADCVIDCDGNTVCEDLCIVNYLLVCSPDCLINHSETCPPL